MNFKGMFILICMIICLFNMASVCASDVDDMPISSDEGLEVNYANELKEDMSALGVDTLSTSDEELLGSDSSVSGNTFQDISDAVNRSSDGDTIYLDGITYTGSGKEVVIDKALTIIGQENTVLDAKGSSRIFNITADNVVLKNIKFLNGNTTGNGGAIYWSSGNADISDCWFENNIAGEQGGANYFENNLTNSNIDAVFINNTAYNNDYFGGGGANFFKGDLTHTTLSGRFTNNTAANGGANLFEGNMTDVRIIGDYSHNIANTNNMFGGGGANFFYGNMDDVALFGNYTSNIASANGGANYFYNENMTDVNITGNYYNNIAKGNTLANGGGANYITANVTNVNIIGNYSNNRAEGTEEYCGGGANYFVSTQDHLVVVGNFTNNTAANGGANFFYNYMEESNVTGNFTNNHGENFGGANFFLNTINRIGVNGIFTNNSALYGGANYFAGYTYNFRMHANFTNNNASESAGANFFYYVGGCLIEGDFINNTAYSGGANLFYDQAIICGIKGNFINNTADENGSANFFVRGNDIYIYGNFTNNTAHEYGSGNYVWDKVSNITISGNFINNIGKSVIHLNKVDKNNLIENSIFLNNGGSNIYVASGNVQVIYNWFGNNASNYNVAPNAGNVNPNNWLFLNATMNPNEFSTMETSDINFKLFTYDKNTRTVSDYDNSLQYMVELKINSTNGDVDKNTVGMDNTVKYTPNVAGVGSVTASIENVYDTVVFDVSKSDSYLSVEDQIIGYGDNAIALDYNVHATGKVNITLTSKKYNKTYENLDLNAAITFQEDIPIGRYDVAVAYSGDERFLNATANAKLIVTDGTTFWDLNNTLNGNDESEITLDKNYTFNPNMDFDFVYGILIDRTLAIDGNGYALNADGQARIFKVTADDVALNDIVFANGNAAVEGGAIYWDCSNADIENCRFVNNTASNGGANYFRRGLDDSKINAEFINNEVNGNGRFDGYGGANYFNGIVSNVSITGNFKDNAAKWGGANYFGNKLSNSTINAVFINNTARNWGVSNYFEGELNDVDMSGKYINNTGDYVIYIANSNEDNVIENSIFLNNNGNCIQIQSGDIKLINCWFGNNATNYNITPDAGNVPIDNWLFLNATADSTTVSPAEITNIVFKLYSFNSTSGNVTDYDNDLLNPVELTLTATNGDVDKKTIDLGNSVEYVPYGAGEGSVTAAIENVEYAVVFDVASVSVLLVDNLTMGYKDGSTLDIQLVDGNGNAIFGARILVNNTIGVYKYDTDDQGIVNVPVNLKPGEYSFDISFEGNAAYPASNATTSVVVNKLMTTISVDDVEVTYKENENYTVTVTDSNGNPVSGITVNVNTGSKILKYRTDSNGVANVPVTLKPDEYTFEVSFAGNAVYEASNSSSTVVVNKAKVNIDASDLVVIYNDGTTFDAILTDANGDAISGVTVKFDFIVDGVVKKSVKYHTDGNGVASAPISLKPGEYNCTISFAGNSLYAAANITKTLTINKAAAVLEASNVNMTYKNGNLTATLTDVDGNAIVSATVSFTQGTSTYRYHTDSNGVATAPINLKPGEYNYTISFDGNSLNGPVNTTATVKVNKIGPVLTAENIDMKFKDGTNYTARLTDAGGNPLSGVVVKVNRTGSNSTYKYKTDSDGMISVPLNFRVGTYDFIAFIENSDIYNPASVETTVTITK